MINGELVIDNFAGGGGASTGIEMATGISVDIAINHDPEAVRLHKTNHPGTRNITGLERSSGKNLEKVIYERNLHMGSKKFELVAESSITFFGRKLFRIKALVSFGNVCKGELGGYIEKEDNLSQDGNAWVCGDAQVCGNAQVYGNADYTTIKGFGSCFRTTTFFRCKDKEIRVSCGCFFGTIPEFRERVKETHKETKIAEEYLMIADLMEKHFSD